MNDELFSIRMRASRGDCHVSGAERIVAAQKVQSLVPELVDRAMSKQERPDKVVITMEAIGDFIRLRALKLVTTDIPHEESGRGAAVNTLQSAGVSRETAEKAVTLLHTGPAASGANMRGAVIMDALTGERLEHDKERGVRVSRFDWSEEAAVELDKQLRHLGLTHFRTREALALATKVAHAPGIVAELCWSDDPEYTAGYVASPASGYVRFSRLKRNGHPKGGRVFFVDANRFELRAFNRYLQYEAVLIDI